MHISRKNIKIIMRCFGISNIANIISHKYLKRNYLRSFDNEERYYDNLNNSCKTCYFNINGFCESKGVDINSVKESVSECWSYRNGITLRAVSDFQDDYEDNIDNFY